MEAMFPQINIDRRRRGNQPASHVDEGFHEPRVCKPMSIANHEETWRV